MAIQIDEKLLSDEAKLFLNNTKNKSQLLRDALECYVKNANSGNQPTTNLNIDVIKDIQDIKKMMLSMKIDYKPIEKEVIKESKENLEHDKNADVASDKRVEGNQEVSIEKENSKNELIEKKEIPSCYL